MDVASRSAASACSWRLLHRAVRAAEPAARSSRPTSLQRQPGNNRAVERDFTSPAARSSPPTAWCWPSRCPSNDRFELPARVPHRRPVRATSPATSPSSSAPPASSDSYNDELAGRRHRLRHADAARRPVRRPRRAWATSRSRCATTCSRWPATRSATGGLGRGARPPHRRDPRHVVDPVLRPQPAGHATTSTAAEASLRAARTPTPSKPPAGPRRTRSATSPGSTFKVVTATAGIERGGVTADDARLPGRSDSYHAAGRRPRRSATSAARRCGGTLFTILQVSCNTAFAQMGVEHGAATSMIDDRRGFGFNQDVPLDLPGAVPVDLPRPDGRRRPADAGPGVDRPERRAGHPAADGAGGRRRRQRRRDHEPHVMQRDPRRPGRRGRRVRRRRVWTHGDVARDRRHAARGA